MLRNGVVSMPGISTEMQVYYRKHYGKNVKNIIVKVAHKMARRILSVIKTETPYQVNYSLIAE